LLERIELHDMQEQFGEILVPTEEVIEMRDGKKTKK
jgi:transcriptional antiterminator NusG